VQAAEGGGHLLLGRRPLFDALCRLRRVYASFAVPGNLVLWDCRAPRAGRDKTPKPYDRADRRW
jgi:hypothetical protein